MTSDRAERLADITADAFSDDPFNRWVFGSFDRMKRTFMAEARTVYLPRGETEIIGDAAAMMWLPPGRSKDLPVLSGLAVLGRLFLSGGPKPALRAVQASNALSKAFPQDPVAYLFTIAVRPSAQGAGHGGALMRAFVNHCDALGCAAWLESSNPDNRGFYNHYGFGTRDILTVAPGAPPQELMYRPAAPPPTVLS
ncbi:MAG: GNAT family N-acetyltransferase [Litorimonas sp.]